MHIEQGILTQTGYARRVNCPKMQDVDCGVEYQCVLTLLSGPGTKQPVVVTFQDDQREYAWEPQL